MKIKQVLLLAFTISILNLGLFAQSSDLHIFGYFQNNFSRFTVSANSVKAIDNKSFLMQQMNVFFQKNFTPELSSFVNIEFTNSVSVKDNIGNFKVEEAWLKYSPSSAFNLKTGVLIPRFNNFNEIKNRTVLLPYIYRPLAYETYFFDQFGTAEFVPTTANIQIYGEVPVSDFYFNYAGFIGNSQTSLLNDNSNVWGPGQDTTDFKLVGGRLGIEYDELELGVSATFDRADLNGYDIGLIPRERIGTYLNYSLKGFDLEAEYINVTYTLSDADKATLASVASNPQDFDKYFIHFNLTYNISDYLAAYAGYDYLNGDDNLFINGGLDHYSFGTCYRLTYAVLLKAQYTYQTSVIYGSDITRNDYLLGVSVNF